MERNASCLYKPHWTDQSYPFIFTSGVKFYLIRGMLINLVFGDDASFKLYPGSQTCTPENNRI